MSVFQSIPGTVKKTVLRDECRNLAVKNIDINARKMMKLMKNNVS